MQAVAAEMNLSETAFVWPEGTNFRLRWFTPTTEVPLCGHATLASAHAMWEDGLVADRAPIEFATRSGRLAAAYEDGWIRLDFPARPSLACAVPDDAADVLGVPPVRAARDDDTLILEMRDAQAVRAVVPERKGVRALAPFMVIVTAPATTAGVEFVSRVFAPNVGIDEDPVTGAAHCYLGPYWERRLDRAELCGHQISRRGGMVRVRCRGERVDLLGQAVTVLRGTLVD